MKIMTNNSQIQDLAQRQRALDPTQSFIVQAPAGSGKTELLTQRFLNLLNFVKQPEEILAITFTKKSSAEMRGRIIEALEYAHHFPEPDEPHKKQTWQLAKCALQRNQSLNWNLLDNPNRLQIQTIDSFNASLTRQLPLLSHFGAPMDIADNATVLYREAVREFLSHLEENVEWASAIEKLLLHMDNDLNKVEILLINMLAKRDQWLLDIASNANNPELRKTLENNLSTIVTDTLVHLYQCFPIDLREEILQLSRFAAQNLRDDQIDLSTFPNSKVRDKLTWLWFSKLLLTDKGEWRKTINKNQGFPSASDSKNNEEKNKLNSMKDRFKELIDQLSKSEELHNALNELIDLPDHQYSSAQWEALDALHDVLRIASAQLNLIFKKYGKIDYIENAFSAVNALGTEEEPTDITLVLDYKIHHILIDEFQDTSNSQYRLVKKLIAGWQANDGRTLFVVGDPMQSIYRFREAEVGLFIRARKYGIGHLYLEPLTLSVNFRSVTTIVDWVNQYFQKIFPLYEDIANGSVSYSASTACKIDPYGTSTVKLHSFLNAKAERQAQAILQLIENIKPTHPDYTIAILVRSRTHLKEIIPAIKSAKHAFRALEIDPLTKKSVIQDLLSLTHALLQPADRIAWLAILRAPWCGLLLSDLLIIAGDKNKAIIYQQLQNPDIIKKISTDGQKRLARILPVLNNALVERQRNSLRLWIEKTWLQLGGPACIDQSSDLEDVKDFFSLLEKLEHASDLNNRDELNDAVKTLFAAPDKNAGKTLQIMTIHNAKGLQFDTVILPHLERKSPRDEKKLLQWMEYHQSDDETALILAPINATGTKENAIYDFITRKQNIKSSYECGRLLYVAATRAIEQLHLFFNLESRENQPNEIKKPATGSLLEKMWPVIQHNITHHTDRIELPNNQTIPVEKKERKIKRLVSCWENPIIHSMTNTIAYHQKKSGFDLPNQNQKHIGTVVHQILQNLSLFGLSWWQKQNKSTQQNYIRKHLLLLAVTANHLTDLMLSVETAITNTLNDEKGRWILQNHTDSESEFRLTMNEKNFIIDRTFVDETGIRWIIDYKTSHYVDSSLDNFLSREQKKYESQLWDYYQAIKQIDSRPVRVGLYFPMLSAWREWEF